MKRVATRRGSVAQFPPYTSNTSKRLTRERERARRIARGSCWEFLKVRTVGGACCPPWKIRCSLTSLASSFVVGGEISPPKLRFGEHTHGLVPRHRRVIFIAEPPQRKTNSADCELNTPASFAGTPPHAVKLRRPLRAFSTHLCVLRGIAFGKILSPVVQRVLIAMVDHAIFSRVHHQPMQVHAPTPNPRPGVTACIAFRPAIMAVACERVRINPGDVLAFPELEWDGVSGGTGGATGWAVRGVGHVPDIEGATEVPQVLRSRR